MTSPWISVRCVTTKAAHRPRLAAGSVHTVCIDDPTHPSALSIPTPPPHGEYRSSRKQAFFVNVMPAVRGADDYRALGARSVALERSDSQALDRLLTWHLVLWLVRKSRPEVNAEKLAAFWDILHRVYLAPSPGLFRVGRCLKGERAECANYSGKHSYVICRLLTNIVDEPEVGGNTLRFEPSVHSPQVYDPRPSRVCADHAMFNFACICGCPSSVDILPCLTHESSTSCCSCSSGR
ncbi:hypothetical protein C8Q80DRAFT_849497 [Daedaleopsis nitida]|nr:hypothetical protein C8Q80DRAFT_849497 [Daedaleopsis nitida]